MENPIMKNIVANLPKAPKQVDYMPINMELEFANGITSGSGSNTSGSSTMIHTSGSNTNGNNTSGSSNSDYMEIEDETKVSSTELRKNETQSSSATYTILPKSRSSSSSVKEVLHASGSNTSGNNTSGNNTSGNNTSGSNSSGSNARSSNASGSNASGSNVSGSKNSDYMEIEDDTKVSSIATNSNGKILEKTLENSEHLEKNLENPLMNNTVANLPKALEQVVRPTSPSSSSRVKEVYHIDVTEMIIERDIA